MIVKVLFLLFLSILAGYSQEIKFENKPLFLQKAEIIFKNKSESEILLKQEDKFISALSEFDMSARLKTDKFITKNEFLDYIGKQTLDWDDSEKIRLYNIIISINNKFQNYNINLPESINLIKTSGQEEGEAPYCRGNSIILPIQILNDNDIELERKTIHELFHIISKNNEEIKNKCYSIISFKKCPKLNFPKEISNFKITNPDDPLNDYYIELKNISNSLKVIPVLYSKEYYDLKKSGVFFNYLNFKLLSVTITNNETKADYSNNNILLYDVAELPDYINKIGINTPYIISPDEILADNFEIMINGKIPEDKILIEKRR